MPESLQFTLSRFEKIWIADGSTLEALFRKLKSLEDVKEGKLAGKIGVVIDLVTRLPVEIWFNENPSASDTRFEANQKRVSFSQNFTLTSGIKLQIWATWLFYTVLVDLGDAVADELSLPFDRVSLEMIYRGLYYFHSASTRGEANDPVQYFANPDNQKILGIVKRERKQVQKLIIAPFPEKQRGSDHFFFQFPPKSSLTTCLHA